MTECLFCKIVHGTIPAQKIYEDEHVLGFKDLYPQARVHLIFIPKNHGRNVLDLSATEAAQIITAIQKYVPSNEDLTNGFRIVTNQGKNGGQSVFHTHFHLLGGEALSTFGA